MPNWLVVGLFVAIVAALVVIVWWEFRRARDAPHSMTDAVRRYLETDVTNAKLPLPSKPGRAFGAWD